MQNFTDTHFKRSSVSVNLNLLGVEATDELPSTANDKEAHLSEVAAKICQEFWSLPTEKELQEVLDAECKEDSWCYEDCDGGITCKLSNLTFL